MELDELDRALIRELLGQADASQRELARRTGSTAPTVGARIEKLEDLGLLGPARRDADLTRLGQLVLVLAPPSDREALGEHERVFQVYRSQQNRVVALALLEDADQLSELHASFPRAETHVLIERLASRTPPFTGERVQATCSQCGKAIEGDEGIRLTLGGRTYLACCPTCEQRLRERFERHASDA